MICIIRKGSGFRGVANYLLHGGRGHIIGGSMAGRSARELAHEAGQLRKLRPTLGRAVAHFSLSAAPEDRLLSDDDWAAIAAEFLGDLGYQNCPHVIVRHRDTEHSHIHLACLRIDASGKTVPDSNDRYKAEKSLGRIEKRFGLGTVNVKDENLPGAGPRSRSEKLRPQMPLEEEETMRVDRQVAAHIAARHHPDLTENSSDPNEQAQAGLAWAGDNPSERKRREMRRLTKIRDYEELVRRLLDPDVSHVHQHPRGAAIYLRRPERISDEGDRLTAYNMDNERAARSIVALAASRGWTSIVFSGTSGFVAAAMRQAVHAGLPVRPTDAVQMDMLEQILAEQGCATGILPAPLAFRPPVERDPDVLPIEDDVEEPRVRDFSERLAKRRQQDNGGPRQQHRPGQ
jgi:hypothetical protein